MFPSDVALNLFASCCSCSMPFGCRHQHNSPHLGTLRRPLPPWQPVELLSSKETDEWMYELQKMEAGDGARVAKDRALGELFALAASGASPARGGCW